MKTSKDPQSPSASEDGVCPVLCHVQPRVEQGRQVLPCAGNTGLGLLGPQPKETRGVSEGSPQKERRGRVGVRMGMEPSLGPRE